MTVLASWQALASVPPQHATRTAQQAQPSAGLMLMKLAACYMVFIYRSVPEKEGGKAEGRQCCQKASSLPLPPQRSSTASLETNSQTRAGQHMANMRQNQLVD